jgi:hypothetical protein
MYTSALKARTVSDAVCKSKQCGMHEVDMRFDGYDEYSETAEELIAQHNQQNLEVARANNRMPVLA